ncbi:MAG: hypothetical protein JWM11_6469, partial [Planctomycetaceae bacterium]|nr:hypothetical protein [Planctomycetaceae bacterium]
IVTCRPVKDELDFLTYELGSEHRDKTTAGYKNLLEKLKEKVGDFKSQNGRGFDFWVDRTYWGWVHSREAIINENLLKTMVLVTRHGQFMAPDQLKELYQRLVRKVYEGGLAKWKREPDKKKFLRSDIFKWLAQAIDDAVHPARLGTGKKLEEKLRDAAIPDEDHEAAAHMRIQYRIEGLSPKYSETGTKRNVEAEIAARLLSLRANLDGELINDNGVAFHARCLNAIDQIHESLPEKDRPPIQILYGCMYNMADRGTHRFVRAKS